MRVHVEDFTQYVFSKFFIVFSFALIFFNFLMKELFHKIIVSVKGFFDLSKLFSISKIDGFGSKDENIEFSIYDA